MFSGGTYREVARWLENFLRSHAKRVDPRIEVEIESGDEREGTSYAATFRLGSRVTPASDFQYEEVAAQRGNLAWCHALADRTRTLVREHVLAASTAASR